jgi:hypothetical protein
LFSAPGSNVIGGLNGAIESRPGFCQGPFSEISEAELEPQIPPHAEDNDFRVEMAALEKIIHAEHPVARPQKGKDVPANMRCFSRLHQNPTLWLHPGVAPSRWLPKTPAWKERISESPSKIVACNTKRTPHKLSRQMSRVVH